jgi:hypothetical protein
MVSSLSSSSSASVSSAKGKEPADRPAAPYFSYLEWLPTEIHNLIVPLLVDSDLTKKVTSLMVVLGDKRKPLLERFYATRRVDLCPTAGDLLFTIYKCRAKLREVDFYRAEAKKAVEFVPTPNNLKETGEFLEVCQEIYDFLKVRSSIEERKFAVSRSEALFKYLDGREEGSVDLPKLDGFSVSSGRPFGRLYVRIEHLETDRVSPDFYCYDFGGYRDVALANQGILFVAKPFNLEVYDLNSTIRIGRMTLPRATLLYKLDYQFDKITWDNERRCLMGEKNGVVTELKVDSSAKKAQPQTKSCQHLGAKVAYVAKKVFKILFVEGPKHAYKATIDSIKSSFDTFGKTVVLLTIGAAGVGLIGLGLVICSIANPIFAILGYVLCSVGGSLACCVAFTFVLAPVVGVLISTGETVRSFINLHKEHIFS